jgi:hypothetical protein
MTTLGSSGITLLSNGNFVINSPEWDSATVADVGAVTWGSGTTGVTGVVSSANSLVGSHVGDNIGLGGITELTNGNALVRSPYWDNNVTGIDVGAVTFLSGTTGVTGVVSSANSLVGSKSGDNIGSDGITELSSGHFIVRSGSWDGTNADVGALTWGSSTTGVTGVVSSANSLVGTTAGGNVAYYSTITELTNGNFVVINPYWDSGATVDVGAVTFGSGTTGVSGVVGAGTSLVGSKAYDHIGYNGITELSNGSYLVWSPYFDNGVTTVDAGALTWGSGTTGVKGVVSTANSLVGTAADNVVYTSTITELGNGNFLVINPYWDNGAATDAGAVTWGSGTTGVKGLVSAANSLIGSTTGDNIGNDYYY